MTELTQWATTTIKTPIKLLSSNSIFKLKKPILFIGGVHGDEPEGVNLANKLLDFLKSHNVITDWVVIPCLNPDGYNKKTRTNLQGVDLNRNFASPDWSEKFEKPRYYPGNKPGSEPETQALTQLIKTIQPHIIIHFHSWKPSIILTGPKELPEAKLFSECSGYPLELDIGYPTPGSLGQFAWQSLNIPVICIEEKEQVDPEESWLRFKPAFESILIIKK